MIRRPNRQRICRGMILAAFALFIVVSAFAEDLPRPPHRILLLHPFEPFLPYSVTVNQSIRRTLLQKKGEKFEFFVQYLDLARFKDRTYERELVNLLREKYKKARPDLIIAFLDRAFDFALKYRSEAFGDAPLVFCTVEKSRVHRMEIGRDVTGVLMELDPAATLEAALQLQPDAKRVVVIGGVHRNDRIFNDTVLRAFKKFEKGLEFSYLLDRPIEDVYTYVRALPPNTIVFFITMFEDGAGKAQVPMDVVARLSECSPAPVYGLFDSYFGAGIVGGRLVNFEMQGRSVAEIAYRILHGEKPAMIAHSPSPNVFMFDWRQLKRWDFGEERLPVSSVVQFKEYTVWDLYKWRIIGVSALSILEAVLIVFLLIHRAKRRKAEKALLLTQFSLDHASEAVVRIDSNGRFLYVNDASCRHYGYTRDELLSMHVFDLNVHPDSSAWPAFVAEVAEKKSKTLDIHQRRKDGVIVLAEVRVDLVEFRGEKHVLAFIRDITERQRAEKELLDSRNFLEALLAASPIGFVTVRDRTIEWISEFSSRICGYSVEELVGKNARLLYESDEEYERAGQILYQQGWMEMNAVRKDASRVPTLLRVAPVDESRWIVTIEDTTELKRLESQLIHAQKMEAVGTLAGGVAHDFNNILSVITGFAGLLKMRTPLDDVCKSYVDHILNASDRAVFLTSSLLAFSRKQIINPKPVNLNGAIEKTRKILSRLIGEDIEMKTMLSSQEPVAMVDEGQLDQILVNLVTNARDAMPRGGKLTVKADIVRMDEAFIAQHGYGKTGVYAVLSVSDDGSGMDEGTRERIFEPFFTTKEQGKGTGLGLSIVYGIVKQHNGYIGVNSILQGGSEFTVYLPLVKSAEAMPRAVESGRLPGGDETVLVGEDEESLRTFLKMLLENVGYRVLHASDGVEVLRQFDIHGEDIDLVLLDVVMPKMNGWEVYKQLRTRKTNLKVIFCSGYTHDLLHQKGIEEEGLELIQKPIMPEELLGKIRNVLDGQRGYN